MNNRGTVFMATMISMLIMSMTAGYFFTNSNQSLVYVKAVEKSAQAKYLADAGLSRALEQLNSSWSSSLSIGSTSLGSGTYSVAMSSTSGRYLVTSTGTVQGKSITSSAEVIPPAVSALDYVIAAGGNATIDAGTGQSSGVITGDIYGAGNVSIDGPSSGGVMAVVGDVDAGGSITNGSNVTVSGTQTPSYSTTVAFPTVDYSYYQNIATTNGYYYSSDKTYNGASPLPAAPAGGVIYVNGNITIQGTQTTTACIVATGNITINKSGSTYPKVTIAQFSNYPAIMAAGNVTFSSTGNGDAYLTATGLIYCGGNFSFSSGNHDSLTTIGSIVAAGNITMSPQSWNIVTATYLSQNPPGFTVSGATMTVASYNS